MPVGAVATRPGGHHVISSAMVVRGLAALLMWVLASCRPASPAPAPGSAGHEASRAAESRADWQNTMAKLPLPRAGCFLATYPSHDWAVAPCAKVPLHPPQTTRGPPREMFGSLQDNSAQTTTLISSATGSFLPGAVVTGEHNVGPAGDSGNGPNSWSLQLNTNMFSTSACNGHPSCQGWQQFLFTNDTNGGTGGTLLMQYWLFDYGPGDCPTYAATGVYWYKSASNSNNCFGDSNSQISLGLQSLASLPNLGLIASATSGGQDTLKFLSDPGAMPAIGQDSVLNLSQAWRGAEFNVFGIWSSAQANFDAGTTLTAELTLSDGSTTAPSCPSYGYTLETSSLTLVNPCCQITSPPGILFTESNLQPPPQSMCACPATATWNPALAKCICGVADQVVKNGECQYPSANACGGQGVLVGAPGQPCGAAGACEKLACAGPDSLQCVPFKNVCGGCSTVLEGPGEGPQPGESCACSNGTRSRYYCTSKGLACDCPSP